MERIAESDWKVLKELKSTLLARFCQRTLGEIAAHCREESAEHHQHYLDVLSRITDRDRELSEAFDDLSRSTAVFKLARMCSLGLLDDVEREKFSQPTLDKVEALLAFEGTER